MLLSLALASQLNAAESKPTKEAIVETARKLATDRCARAPKGCEFHAQALPADLPAEWKGARWRVMISHIQIYVNGQPLYAPGQQNSSFMDFDESGKLVQDSLANAD